MIRGSDWIAAVALIEAAGSVTVAGHVNPDGDAVGSVLALALALRRRGVRVQAGFPEPYGLPAPLRDLPGQELLAAPHELEPAPLFVAVDTASPARLGSLRSVAEAAGRLLLIDHHASNAGFGDVVLLDVEAAAAAVVVAELVERLGIAYDVPIATCLYAAIASDTGSFRYASTTAGVHRLVARLLEAGARHEEISRALFDTKPAGWLPMLAEVLGRAVLDPDAFEGAGLVWTSVTAADLRRHGLPFELAESVVDVVRTTDSADVAVVFKEQAPRLWAVSMRSRGRLDVGTVASGLGGGGHRLAAGYTAHGPLPAALTRLRSEFAP